MKKSFIKMCSALFFAVILSISGFAVSTYVVKPGDSMWKIAVKTQTGLAELIKANPGIKNPALIYPNQKITIPDPPAMKTFEDEVVKLVNAERAKYGLGMLTQNWEVSRVARTKSEDMAARNYFSHTSPTYGSPFNMMENYGIRFSAAAENIAMGQRTPAEVVRGWMNSPGHRANILNRSFTQIGVGAARNKNGVIYWTQLFIKPV